MIRLSLKLALLALFVALVGAGLELQARRMYRDGSDLFHKRASFERARATAEVLVLGPSHAEYAIDPALLGPKTFNLAFPSQDLGYDQRLFELAAPQMPELECVVDVLTYFAFDFRTDALNAHDVREYWTHFGLAPRAGLTAELVLDLSVYLRHRGTFVSHVLTSKTAQPFQVLDVPQVAPGQTGQWLTSTGHRFIDSALDPAKVAETCAARVATHAARHTKATPEAPSGINAPALTAMLEGARQRGLGVLLVQTPYVREYREAYPKALVEEHDRRLRQLLAGFPEVVYVDASAGEGYALEEFVDCDHLNQRGAQRFTRRIEDELRACVERGKKR